jgi:hypothetical protein
VGFIRSRFWPGRRFTSLLDLNRQSTQWRDDFANNREHEETGKVPALVFKHEEQPRLKPLPTTPFDTDDIEATGVTKLFRVASARTPTGAPARWPGVIARQRELGSVYLGTKRWRCTALGVSARHRAQRPS